VAGWASWTQRQGRPGTSAFSLAIAALVLATLAAWLILLATSGDSMEMPGLPTYLGSWAVMMAAMMLPSAMPALLTFVRLSEQSGQPARGYAFVGSYVTVWGGFSVAATAAQWALQALGWVDPMMASTSRWLTAALLVMAGAYQLSPLKRSCLSQCRTPVVFILGHWRPGIAGAFSMGARHGLFCVGCCWALMALLFVGGAMNLAWAAGLSVIVALEKLLPGGERLSGALGLGLIALGIVRACWAG